MSIQLTGHVPFGDKLQPSFIAPEKPPITIGATVRWANDYGLVGFQFLNSDATRQA